MKTQVEQCKTPDYFLLGAKAGRNKRLVASTFPGNKSSSSHDGLQARYDQTFSVMATPNLPFS